MSVVEVEATWNDASGNSWAQGPQLHCQPCWLGIASPIGTSRPCCLSCHLNTTCFCLIAPTHHFGPLQPRVWELWSCYLRWFSTHPSPDQERRPLCCPSMAALFATCTLEMKEAARETKWALIRARTAPGVPKDTYSSAISLRWFWQMLFLLLPGSVRYPSLRLE